MNTYTVTITLPDHTVTEGNAHELVAAIEVLLEDRIDPKAAVLEVNEVFPATGQTHNIWERYTKPSKPAPAEPCDHYYLQYGPYMHGRKCQNCGNEQGTTW